MDQLDFLNFWTNFWIRYMVDWSYTCFFLKFSTNNFWLIQCNDSNVWNNGVSIIQDFKTTRDCVLTILTLYPIIVLQSKISSARILDNTMAVQYQILFAQISNCSFLPKSFLGNNIIQNGWEYIYQWCTCVPPEQTV